LKSTDAASGSGRLANLALGLVVGGWLLLAWGILRNLGDPNPMTPRSELEAWREHSLLFISSGATALVVSAWLSGRAFAQARIRASLALLFFLVPMFGLFAEAFMAHA